MWKFFSRGKKAKAGTSAEIPARPETLPGSSMRPVAAASASIQLPGMLVYSGGLQDIRIPDGLEVELDTGGYVTVSGSLPENVTSARYTGGLSFRVSDAVERAASGNRIRIHLVTVSRMTGEALLAYSTNEVGNSGWLKFEVGPEEQVAVLEYNVPKMKQGLGDFIGINPNGHLLTIKSITVEILGAD